MRWLFSVLAMMTIAGPSAMAFDLQGHRGARGLAPENTVAAFATALSIGVTTLELDVGITKDGVLVVHHDIWLNPNTTRGPDGKFLAARGPAIHSLTLAELKRYDVGRIKPGSPYAARFPGQRPIDGERIPALAEVFALVRRPDAEHIRFNIETKITPTSGAATPSPERFADAVVRAIREAGLAERTTVQSFDWRTLAHLRRVAPEIERVCLTTEAPGEDTLQRGKPGPSPWTAGLDIEEYGGSTPRLVAAAGCSVWSPNFRDLAPGSVEAASLVGLKVIPWTINEPAEMERAIALGVDGIITDFPDRARDVMAAKGLPLPAPLTVRRAASSAVPPQ